MSSTNDSKGRGRALQKDKYALKNLKFLGDFMTKTGLTTTTAGEKVGISQVSVYYWLKKDEARLSIVNRLIEACGYKLDIELVDSEPLPDNSPEIIISTPRDRLLSFLSEALAGEDKEAVAEQLGIGTTTIYYWLSHDDMYISYIFKVAQAIGKKVRISITRKNG